MSERDVNKFKPCYNRPMKKIVSFDLDGTLVNGQFGDMVWNHGIPEEFAEEYAIPFEKAKELVRREYELVGDSNLAWYDIEYWLDRFDLPVTADALLERYESYIALLPGAQEVLEILQKKYTLVIASNAARIFVEKELSRTGIAHHFTHIISATTDYQLVKKEGIFYKKLCSILNVSPDEVIHVGDHPIFDFVAPSSLGIESYHFKDQKSGVGSQESGENNGRIITNLMELLDKL
jgi:putative hydrolase of the HAD superfamily